MNADAGTGAGTADAGTDAGTTGSVTGADETTGAVTGTRTGGGTGTGTGQAASTAGSADIAGSADTTGSAGSAGSAIERSTEHATAKRRFTSMWIGEGVSAVGARITTVAVPILAVNTLNAPDWQVGAMVATEGACYLLLGLHAGAWVDRRRRRPVLVATSLARAALLALIPVTLALDVLSMPLLIALSFALAALTMVFDLALFAFVPLVLPRALLTWGNSRLNGTDSVARAAGPAAAGALIRFTGAPVALAISAVGYLVSALGVRLVPVREEPRPRAADGQPRRPMRRDILDGLRFLRGERLLLHLSVLSCLYNVFATVVLAALVPHLVRDRGLDSTAVGLVFAAAGLGGVVGAVLVGRLGGKTLGTSLWTFPTLALTGGLAVPWGHGAVAVLCAGFAFFSIGAGEVVYNTAATTLRQSRTPADMLGRLRSALRTASFSGGVLGGLGGGLLAGATSAQTALFVGSAGSLLVFLLAGLSPVRTATADDGD
ncbi:MFS transporter [Streptomyces sp. NPDC053431]|uniref:MFS transporter n=1 Tax=Streptomyces sp. NPDC053431 TaxID=3365703 RepID=UPI0037D2B812